MRLLTLLLGLFLAILTACGTVDHIEPFQDDNVEGPYTSLTGTVKYVEIEGGFWAIESEEGENYDPMNLPERFQKEGLSIEAEVKVREDVGSIRMYGTIIEIHTIKQR